MNFSQVFFKDFVYFLGTPLSGCFRSFQLACFTREYIFLRKILLPGGFECENNTRQTFSRGVLSGEYILTVTAE